MTKRRQKKKKGNKGLSIYIRCRFCGREFEGNSDDVLREWSQHIGPCEKAHKGSPKEGDVKRKVQKREKKSWQRTRRGRR